MPPVLPGLVSTACQRFVDVVEQVSLARETYRLRLHAPEIARQIVPGQFLMIRQPGTYAPLLGRPFALYDTWRDAQGQIQGIDVVYLVVGRMTSVMRQWQAGDAVEVWGPLGNGFPVPPAGKLLMVAGGIGNTPFPAVAREALGLESYGARTVAPRPPADLTFCYGARSAEYLAGVDHMLALGIDVRIATDDGSAGTRGFVTGLARDVLDAQAVSAIYCCGPEPMMHAVARLAAERAVPCWLSLETPMACGFGACFSCVTRVCTDEGWDYRRVCVEGPVFPASQLVW